MRNVRRLPTNADASSTWRRSSWEMGQNPRVPATWTSTPPLLTAPTTPSTGTPSANACASSAAASGPRPIARRSTMHPALPPISTTRPSTTSPTFTGSRPSASRSSDASIIASDLAPRSMNTASRPIDGTRPRTSSPTCGSRRRGFRSYSARSLTKSSSPSSGGAPMRAHSLLDPARAGVGLDGVVGGHEALVVVLRHHDGAFLHQRRDARGRLRGAFRRARLERAIEERDVVEVLDELGAFRVAGELAAGLRGRRVGGRCATAGDEPEHDQETLHVVWTRRGGRQLPMEPARPRRAPRTGAWRASGGVGP